MPELKYTKLENWVRSLNRPALAELLVEYTRIITNHMTPSFGNSQARDAIEREIADMRSHTVGWTDKSLVEAFLEHAKNITDLTAECDSRKQK